MEFRLVYSGRVLGASRTNTRASLKHEIRQSFHPQLRRLWETNENLLGILKSIGHANAIDQLEADRKERERLAGRFDNELERNEDLTRLHALGDKWNAHKHSYVSEGKDIILREWQRCGYRFLPLVTDKYSLRCSLDILFLRPEESGMLIESGDIDNRVKTIFDALRMPKTLSETGSIGPQPDEDPFYCLLEDDKLVSEVRVTTDQLLLLPQERELKPNDALVVIRVSVKPVEFSLVGMRFMP